MRVDFYIPTLQNDMKFVIWKNYFGGQIVYRILVPPIKNGVYVVEFIPNDQVKGDRSRILFAKYVSKGLKRAWRALTPFFRAYRFLYHKFENTVIFRSGNLHSLCSPGNQHPPKIIFFFLLFFSSKRSKHTTFA